jgi:hypothetical protein
MEAFFCMLLLPSEAAHQPLHVHVLVNQRLVPQKTAATAQSSSAVILGAPRTVPIGKVCLHQEQCKMH